MKVLLVALNAKYIHSSLALRSIKSYAASYEENIKILELTINHEEKEILRQIYKEKPDVIGFSCYIWNMRFVKILVTTLKKILPNTTILLGGPEVSYNAELLFKEMPIDVVIVGEGEKTFKEYLDYTIHHKGDIRKIEGLVYREDKEIIITNPRKAMDLEEVPFMYDDLGEFDNKIIYYEASRGCPFNCQYCLSSIEKGVRFMPLERVLKEMDYFLQYRVKQVKFVDRTFNTNKKYAMAIWRYLMENDNGYTNFHFEIAAELLDLEMLGQLKAARPGLIQFEIGVQSTNEEVLEAIDRKMSFQALEKIVKSIKALHNIHQHLDLIAGLPLENYASFKKSFNDVIALKPEQFQLGFLKVLKGSGLRRDAEKYGIVYHEEAPYEVLYTSHITYEELLKLHAIEEMVERYYNTERFFNSLAYGYSLFESPFDFYEALSRYWEEKGYDRMQHNKAAYYIYLADFIQSQPKAEPNFIKELIRLDWMLHEPLREIPDTLVTLEEKNFKEEINSYLKDDVWIEKWAPEALLLQFRHRKRQMYIDYFSYDVYGWMQGERSVRKVSSPQKLLFDYTTSHKGAICIE